MSAAPQMPPPSPPPVPDRAPYLEALLWAMTGISIGVVILRFAYRLNRSRLGWDDGFMLLALVRTTTPRGKATADRCRYASWAGPSH
jgi:hypothetical protein